MLIGEGFLTAEAGLVVGAEVAAMEEASEVIAQAQADEADALLAAVAARPKRPRRWPIQSGFSPPLPLPPSGR